MPHEYNITSTAKYLISVLLLSIILSVSALTVTYFLYRMEIELRDVLSVHELVFSYYFVPLQTIDVTVYQKNECNKKTKYTYC